MIQLDFPACLLRLRYDPKYASTLTSHWNHCQPGKAQPFSSRDSKPRRCGAPSSPLSAPTLLSLPLPQSMTKAAPFGPLSFARGRARVRAAAPPPSTPLAGLLFSRELMRLRASRLLDDPERDDDAGKRRDPGGRSSMTPVGERLLANPLSAFAPEADEASVGGGAFAAADGRSSSEDNDDDSSVKPDRTGSKLVLAPSAAEKSIRRIAAAGCGDHKTLSPTPPFICLITVVLTAFEDEGVLSSIAEEARGDWKPLTPTPVVLL